MQVNRFLPHQLLPKTHMLSNPNHAIFEGSELMHKNLGNEKYDQSVNLPVLLMKMIRTHNS